MTLGKHDAFKDRHTHTFDKARAPGKVKHTHTVAGKEGATLGTEEKIDRRLARHKIIKPKSLEVDTEASVCRDLQLGIGWVSVLDAHGAIKY